jgi:hypothetical protein
MKTRGGFVSNSSTSSFVLVGWEISLPDAKGLQEVMLALGHPCKNPLPEFALDEDSNEMESTEGNRAAFDLVSSYRRAHRVQRQGMYPSVRLGLPCWGDGSSGVDEGCMLIGMETGSGMDLLDAMKGAAELRSLVNIDPSVRIKVFGGEAEQST